MNASRRISLAIAVSLLAHASLLLLRPPAPQFKPPGPLAETPMTVVITPAELPPEPAREAPPEPPAAAEPRPTPLPPRPRTLPAAPRRVEPPPVATAPVAPAPAIEAPRAVTPPPVDMLAAIEARRDARRAAEAEARAPTVEVPGEDAATRNLRTLTGREGVGGVFQVLRMSSCSGEFAFNGWKPDARSQWREVIEVDATCGQVELAMIKRMIELIRTHYQGDFHWESHRLGRVVVLSARPADQRELEDFLFREFFGTPLANPRAGAQPMR